MAKLWHQCYGVFKTNSFSRLKLLLICRYRSTEFYLQSQRAFIPCVLKIHWGHNKPKENKISIIVYLATKTIVLPWLHWLFMHIILCKASLPYVYASIVEKCVRYYMYVSSNVLKDLTWWALYTSITNVTSTVSLVDSLNEFIFTAEMQWSDRFRFYTADLCSNIRHFQLAILFEFDTCRDKQYIDVIATFIATAFNCCHNVATIVAASLIGCTLFVHCLGNVTVRNIFKE